MPAPKAKKPTLEFIQWKDHCNWASSSWHTLQEMVELTLVNVSSVGWVVHEDADRVVLAAHVDHEGGNLCGEMSIIKRAIVKRKKLKQPT